ncbi:MULTISPECIES: DNA-deoxyinosine glycosylase [Sulfurospirillum]|uniref:DNA-deoxyinosine glycosylase n=1 Tax=Sulfurospirillum TaxID=57665 RepID=UPI000544113A|nr:MULTISPECIES: DNA-deoxyinosine glycosylase [Sulfurospirillum]KHG34033.1 MAG: DNA glycosylase [Sulfurospirillum sp. MES]
MLYHPFEPVYDATSRVLVLGSFPSVKSREEAFYYAHPQNRFWKVIAALYGVEPPCDLETKKALLHTSGIAIWDVIRCCDIVGSSDATIQNACGNDLRSVLHATRIERIFCNGQTAAKLYRIHCEPLTKLPAQTLPSTSPANAAWTLEKLIVAWSSLLA